MSDQALPMAKAGKLLLATDGLRYSEGAIREALSLAKRCSCRLIALSVVISNLEFEMTVPQVIENEEEKASEHLETIRKRAAKEGIICKTMTVHGEEPYQEIIDAAINNKADMIIMGRHGRTGLVRLMMGSVTAKVISHAPCNVLVVPPDAKVEWRNILVATDGSKYSNAAAHEAIGIAKRCGSSLVALSAAASEAESASAKGNIKKVAELAAKEDIKVEGLTATGKPYDAIMEAAKQKHSDLIVVGSHGRTGIERLLMGSVAENIICHSAAAVLVVRAQ